MENSVDGSTEDFDGITAGFQYVASNQQTASAIRIGAEGAGQLGAARNGADCLAMGGLLTKGSKDDIAASARKVMEKVHGGK